MSMEFDGSATVYKCTACGDLQIVMEGEQPSDECNLCSEKGKRIDKALSEHFAIERENLRKEGFALGKAAESTEELRGAWISGVAYGDFMSDDGRNWTDTYRTELQEEAGKLYPDAALRAEEEGK